MIITTVETDSGALLQIGRQGEHDARQIWFDLTWLIESFGEGSAVLVHQRTKDDAPYICQTTQENNRLIWVIDEIDTAYEGFGKAEIRWTVDGTLAKTVIYKTSVLKSLTGDTVIPDPYESWYDRMMSNISNIINNNLSINNIDPATFSTRIRSEFFGNYRPQSMCYDSANRRFFIVGNSIDRNGSTRICITSDLEFFSDASFFTVMAGHANDCTYNPVNERLYITGGYDPAVGIEGDINGNTVAEIDVDNQQLIRRITISEYPQIMCIEYYNGGYIIGTFGYGSLYDENFNLIKKNVFDWSEDRADTILGVDYTKTGTQGITIYNNIVYRSVAYIDASIRNYQFGGIVYKFSTDGEYLGYLTFTPNRVDTELESIVVVDNAMYILTDGEFLEIYKSVLYGKSSDLHALKENDDLDNCLAPGTYYAYNAAIARQILHNPVPTAGFTLFVFPLVRVNAIQILVSTNAVPTIMVRTYLNSTKFGDWYRFTGVKVTT